ncbi:MAG: hypothetical protein QGG36_24715 [Pirellulaceae bacterium]|nr:hypothetical protein [Pirellulaceae bacterium]
MAVFYGSLSGIDPQKFFVQWGDAEVEELNMQFGKDVDSDKVLIETDLETQRQEILQRLANGLRLIGPPLGGIDPLIPIYGDGSMIDPNPRQNPAVVGRGGGGGVHSGPHNGPVPPGVSLFEGDNNTQFSTPPRASMDSRRSVPLEFPDTTEIVSPPGFNSLVESFAEERQPFRFGDFDDMRMGLGQPPELQLFSPGRFPSPFATLGADPDPFMLNGISRLSLGAAPIGLPPGAGVGGGVVGGFRP